MKKNFLSHAEIAQVSAWMIANRSAIAERPLAEIVDKIHGATAIQCTPAAIKNLAKALEINIPQRRVINTKPTRVIARVLEEILQSLGVECPQSVVAIKRGFPLADIDVEADIERLGEQIRGKAK